MWFTMWKLYIIIFILPSNAYSILFNIIKNKHRWSKKNDNEEKNKNETKDNIENIDDKEFELDEDKKEDNNDKIKD